MEVLLVFLAGFTQVGLQTLQVRNVMHSRHGTIALTSCLISAAWAVGVIHTVGNPKHCIPAFIVGCALGAELFAWIGSKNLHYWHWHWNRIRGKKQEQPKKTSGL